jgi:hypothetical protein
VIRQRDVSARLVTASGISADPRRDLVGRSATSGRAGVLAFMRRPGPGEKSGVSGRVPRGHWTAIEGQRAAVRRRVPRPGAPEPRQWLPPAFPDKTRLLAQHHKRGLTGTVASSSGGTRTPDMRIMIPSRDDHYLLISQYLLRDHPSLDALLARAAHRPDPDLELVIDCWPKVPTSVRKAIPILTMLQALVEDQTHQ